MNSSGFITTPQVNNQLPLHVSDMIPMSVGEIVLLLERQRCVGCEGRLKITKINGNGALTVVMKCVECKEVNTWASSPKIVSYQYKNIYVHTARVVVAAILSGLTYRMFAESHDLAGEQHLGEYQWAVWEERVGKAVVELLEVSERNARKEHIVDNKIKGTVDCRWSSRGHNAEEATVILCDVASGKVLYHSHLTRKPNAESKFAGMIYLLIFII